VNVAHYTEKEDSYIIAQLTDAELSTLGSAGSVYVSDNFVHSNQTDLIALSDEELNDTFGSSRWDRTTDFIVDVTITEFNSVYLGTAKSGPEVVTDYGSRFRPTAYINSDVLNLQDIEDLSQLNHRSKQHSNGISGGITAFLATIDGTTSPDELNITDLGNDEFGYIGGHRVSSGEIGSAYLSGIAATNSDYFPTGNTEYYVYVYYDTGLGVFRTTAFKVPDVPASLATLGKENYLLLCKVFVDAGRSTINAYENDKRYDLTASDNPTTDLRKFGTIDSINISDDGFSNMAGDNLISNGEFEEGITNDVPNEWNGNGGILDNVNLLGGKHSLLLAPSEIVISNPIPYSQLATYNLRVAAKAEGTSGDYTVGIRGYVGKDWTDAAFSDDATAPINISYLSTVTTESKTTSWADSGSGIFTSADWSWTTPIGGNYTAGDLDKIKYIRVFIRNNGGTHDLYIDNVKLVDNNNITATSTELNKLDGVTASTAELNILDGVTANTTEINRIADGITATAAEVNQALDGITANVTDTNLNTLTGGGSTSLHSHDGSAHTHLLAAGATDVNASTAEVNKLVGLAGAVVGTSDVQTLTDKTLTAPDINGGTLDAATSFTVANDIDIGDFKLTNRQTVSETTVAGQTAVYGSSASSTGVEAHSVTGVGLYATSSSTAAVSGSASVSYGVSGRSTAFVGVYGSSGTLGSAGVHGRSDTFNLGASPGVKGTSALGVGVYGSSASSYGGKFEVADETYGGAIYLVPRSGASAPTHTAAKGTLVVTSTGVLYINTTGTTAWSKVGAQ
ncbi:hypothetical protein KAR91_18410, partial [Candidatus Pacearchaeota archaeon]|nr:hypothetical protein [Candidatus Pacearchaeota archaeon]